MYGRMAVARHPPQWYLVEEVLVILSLEVVRSVGATAQALAILQLLDVAQTSGDATVAIGVVAVEGHADLAVTAGVDLTLVEDRLNLGIHHLGSLTAVGVEEVAASIGFIVGTVDVAVKYCNKTAIISTYGIIEVPEPTAYRTPDNITAPSAAVASDMRCSASIAHGNKLCTENE